MTAIAKIINVGNHPDDLISVEYPSGDTTLPHGEALGIYWPLVGGIKIRTKHNGNGGDHRCYQHDAIAVCTEGPGMARVRGEFNPSGQNAVQRIKTLAAAMINEVHKLHNGNVFLPESEEVRLQGIAMDQIEQAAMWAVKAATIEH